MKLLAFIVLILTVGCGPAIILDVPPAEERAQQNKIWLEALRATARPGDWLVIRGYKAVDNLVVAATNMPLSHAAVYDQKGDQVIEAVGEGVRATSLEAFVDHAHRVLLIRPRWWTPERGDEAAAFAQGAVGDGYDFLGTVGAGTAGRYYCSELCVEAYRAHHVDKDHLPRVMEPGQMFLWGQVLHDTGPRY
jgi:hypothetical protein